MAINTGELPSLAGADHRCDECNISYAGRTVPDADRVLAGTAGGD